MNLDQNRLNSPAAAPTFAGHDALPPGTRFGEFEIVRVLGVGGFGIVYLAQDHSLERQVALKEYMPASLAARGHGPMITLRSDSFAETYALGLRSFINEARLLARFDHPSLVNVYRFWEDNATAYMVMPYLQGITLRDARRGMAQPPDEEWVRGVLDPMLDALEQMHREGVFHRDIAPDNILLPPEGPPILLDFGAARQVLKDRTQSLTAFLKPSYAPIEQYAEMDTMRQGPWTDIYALGAVMHYLLFGVPPAPSIARAVQGDDVPIEARVVSGVSPRFMSALAWMLGVRPLQRPQDVAALRDALSGRSPIPPGVRNEAEISRDRAPRTVASSVPVAPSIMAPPAEPTIAIERAPATFARVDTAHQPTVPVTAPVPRPVSVAAPPPMPMAATLSASSRMGSMPPGLPPVYVPVGEPARQASALRPFWAVPLARARLRTSRRGVVFAGVGATAAMTVTVLWLSVGPGGGPHAQGTSIADAASAVHSVPAAPPDSRRGIARTAGAVGNAPVAADIGASAARAKSKPKPKPSAPSAPASLTALAGGPTTAREACAGKSYLALAMCVDRECERPQFRADPECARVLEIKRLRAER